MAIIINEILGSMATEYMYVIFEFPGISSKREIRQYFCVLHEAQTHHDEPGFRIIRNMMPFRGDTSSKHRRFHLKTHQSNFKNRIP